MYQLPELLTFPNLVHGFSNRADGNMSFKWGEEKNVIENKKRFLQELKLDAAKGVCAELVHRDAIVRVNKKEAAQGILTPPTTQADGLISNEPGIFLMHVVADCISLLFYDPENQAIGLAHAGWKGTDLKIAQKMVKTMVKEFATDPSHLVIGFGPSIHSCCLKFDNPLQESIPAWAPFLKKLADGQTSINVRGYNLFQLTEVGVEQENIFMSEYCTAHSDKFFSHYQDMRNKKPEARFATVIALK